MGPRLPALVHRSRSHRRRPRCAPVRSSAALARHPAVPSIVDAPQLDSSRDDLTRTGQPFQSHALVLSNRRTKSHKRTCPRFSTPKSQIAR
jgi:hypothetical protein